MKKLIPAVLFSCISLSGFAQIDTISCNLYQNNCNIGIRTSNPREMLHLVDGNFLIEGGKETAIIIKKDTTYSSIESGESPDPIFYLGRIVRAGDGDPEFRFLYKDTLLKKEIPVLEFDRKGIVASVKPAPPSKQYRGSHFEGFYHGAIHPYFRLNSHPKMRLEMGAGGTEDVDVAIERFSTKTLGFYTGKDCQVVIDQLGNLGIGTSKPISKVEIATGDLLISCDTCGLTLKSPNGKKWKITVSDKGELSTKEITSHSGIITNGMDEKIIIYPNPSNNRITVELSDKNYRLVDVEIFNLDGKMIYMKQYSQNAFDINISDFPNNLYVLNIKDKYGNLIQTKKIIKN
jgi:hypothetical protein